jgi:hypothetical protein
MCQQSIFFFFSKGWLLWQPKRVVCHVSSESENRESSSSFSSSLLTGRFSAALLTFEKKKKGENGFLLDFYDEGRRFFFINFIE